LFKYIPLSDAPVWPPRGSSDDDLPSRQTRSVRLRVGRGGRRLLDRRDFVSRLPKRLKKDTGADEIKMDVDKDVEGVERQRRLEEQWRYDQDDAPTFGPQGQDEQDRVLVDEYQTKYFFSLSCKFPC
jgi:enhancer of polycomb-like protein